MLLNRQKIAMFECFTLNTHEKITASQIALKHNVNQKSVYLFMEDLEHAGILTSEMQGKNKLYQLHKSNAEAVVQFLCAVEHLRTLYFYQDYPNIKFVVQKLLPHIHGIAAIFGSYSKRTQKTTSDIDLFIAGKYDMAAVTSISDTFNVEINVKHQSTFQDNALTREIKKNHILTRNTEQFVREANQWIN